MILMRHEYGYEADEPADWPEFSDTQPGEPVFDYGIWPPDPEAVRDENLRRLGRLTWCVRRALSPRRPRRRARGTGATRPGREERMTPRRLPRPERPWRRVAPRLRHPHSRRRPRRPPLARRHRRPRARRAEAPPADEAPDDEPPRRTRRGGLPGTRIRRVPARPEGA